MNTLVDFNQNIPHTVDEWKQYFLSQQEFCLLREQARLMCNDNPVVMQNLDTQAWIHYIVTKDKKGLVKRQSEIECKTLDFWRKRYG